MFCAAASGAWATEYGTVVSSTPLVMAVPVPQRQCSDEPGAAGEQRCRTVTRYENRTVSYDVVYEYQGVRRSVRLAQDPGERIALDVSVTPQGAATAAYGAPRSAVVDQPAPAVVYAPQPQVVYQQPYDYGPQYYGPQVYVNPWPLIGIGLGWRGGWYGHRR
jgi:hypothetical protein